jgi:hypothetical protein
MRMIRKGISYALAAACALALAPRASADTPALQRVTPRGGQRGTEIEITLAGARLKDAAGLFLYKPGLEVLKVEAADESSVRVRLRIAADAPLGEHPLRLRTATGVSELRTFYVGPFPAADEKEPNNDFKAPQPVPLNTTVSGVVTNEDVDYFAVEAKKGQRITAEVEGMRLGSALFDPYVAILDARRFEVAVSDDTALFLQDPVCSVIAPEDGTYVVQVRESSYGGGDSGQYRLHVGTFPRPLAVYPPGGKAGETLDATFIGDVSGPLARKLQLPAAAAAKLGVFAEDADQSPPSPNWIRVSEFPNVLEAEPNDSREQATRTELPLPVALNGIIGKAGDEDWFRFKASKGQTFDIKVYARALRSPLDPVLEVHAAGGAQIAANDDQGGPDSIVRFSAPADGDYELKVRDHLRKGGPAYVYRVEFNAAQPTAYTHIPAYEREPNDQLRQWVAVPKGNRFSTWIRVNRSNFGGDMTLAFEGLPAGVRAFAELVPAGIDRVPVVFEAAPDAPVAGALAEVVATTTDGKISGRFFQSVNLVYGPPNNTIFYGTAVDRLAVAVVEEAPYRLSIVEPKAPLVNGGSLGLKVVAERKPGFTKPITLRMLWTPPGVTAAVTHAIPEGQNEAYYPMNADGNAQARSWKLAVLGEADAGRGPVWVSSQPATLPVASPYVAVKIEMATAIQGQPADVVCKLEHLKPFEGKAKLLLHGLPPACAAEAAEREITKDDKEVVFQVKTAAATPVAQHKTLFCQVLVPDQGEQVCHNTGGGGILRVDAPPPAKKDAPAPAAAAAPPKPGEPAKRLSRLEQLRLEAEQKEKK